MAGVGTMSERALPRLSWGPVICGVLLAVACHIVLGLIGAALGLAAAPAESSALGAGAGLWALITPFVSTLLGAWLACRMAAREDTAGTNLHAVMVWSIGLIAGALFLAGTFATGAMAAGTAASGNAGMIQRFAGVDRGPRGQARTEVAADEAARNASRAAGGAAMAALAGLLGAFAGAGMARSRREKGLGLGWRIGIQRTAGARSDGDYARRMEEERRSGSAYPSDRTRVPPATRTEEATREVTRSEGPGAPPVDPYHH
jgi:hypothetical protein